MVRPIKTDKSIISYHQLLGDPRMTWKCLMFMNDAIPKARSMMWLQVQNKLLTTDRIARWRIDMDTKFTLYQNQDETNDHLFEDCEYAQRVWTRLLRWLHKQIPTTTCWDEYLRFIIENCNGRTQAA
ncbi:uncharacterized protein LOC132054163 [Lycium ferocissimum]|uniref:uncharacterized protein LOC132054163 n=1 Tax=Lycium ferocissimum TaxID=112874 RepID=UPI002814F724|nr:uncharacterized protein LOC132054163 [Lycium ferocissimum]